ncbi:O-antigen ligase family protein [bacterium]
MYYYQTRISRVLTKVIEYGLPWFCCIFVLAFYLKTYDSCQIKITLVQMGGVFFIGLWLMKILEERKFILQDKEQFRLLLPVICFLISGIISYFISPFKLTSLEELTRRLIYLLTFFVVVSEFNDIKRIERFIFWFGIGALVSSLYGVVQYLDLDPFIWKRAFGDRIFSTFGNPNFFSAYLVWVVPLILSYILFSKKWLYSIVCILAVFCVYQSKSKASWIGLTVAIVCFVFFALNFFTHFKKQNFKKIMIVAALLTVILGSLGVWIFCKEKSGFCEI